MVTSLSKLTAHLSGKCALHEYSFKSADKYQLYQYILMEMVIWRYRLQYDKVYKRLPKPDEHVEKLLK
jgi:hypothetical protein